eukprot:05802.XXX_328997_329219_1 [CDS] Oithona nana genome sequencing.
MAGWGGSGTCGKVTGGGGRGRAIAKTAGGGCRGICLTASSLIPSKSIESRRF